MGDVVATASTVTVAFGRKLHAVFACQGSDYGGSGGGGGGGGGGGDRIIAGQDSCLAVTAMLIGAQWSRWMDHPPRADILDAGRRRWQWEWWREKLVVGERGLCCDCSDWKSFFGGRGLSWEPPFRAVATTPPLMETRFADPNLNAQNLHFKRQPSRLVPQMRRMLNKTWLKLKYKPLAGILSPSRYS